MLISFTNHKYLTIDNNISLFVYKQYMVDRRHNRGSAVVLPMPDARVLSGGDPEGQRVETLARARELATQGYDRETIFAKLFGNTVLDTVDRAVRANAINLVNREAYEKKSMDVDLQERTLDLEAKKLVLEQARVKITDSREHAEEVARLERKLLDTTAVYVKDLRSSVEEYARTLKGTVDTYSTQVKGFVADYIAEKEKALAVASRLNEKPAVVCPFGRESTIKVEVDLSSRTAEFYSECILASGISQSCSVEERSKILRKHRCPQYAVKSEKRYYEEQTFFGRLFRRDPKIIVRTVMVASCVY